MDAYNGPMRNVTGIHQPLTRKRLADILRMLRKGGVGDKPPRREAVDYRNWLIYLGTYPMK